MWIFGSSVDDAVNTGDPQFENITENILSKFESNPKGVRQFGFLWDLDKQDCSGIVRAFAVALRKKCIILHPVHTSTNLENIERYSHRLSTRDHTFPVPLARCHKKHNEICSEKSDRPERPKNLVKSTVFEGLNCPGLDISTTHLLVYMDVSYATNENLSSQLGTLVLVSL